jgi:hypothetical protein
LRVGVKGKGMVRVPTYSVCGMLIVFSDWRGGHIVERSKMDRKE